MESLTTALVAEKHSERRAEKICAKQSTIANLKAVRVTVGWSHSSGSASVSYALSINGQTAGCNQSPSTAGGGTCIVKILNTGSTTGSATGAQITGATVSGTTSAALTTLAWSSNQTILFTFNVAATDQVTPLLWTVEAVQ